MAETAEIKLGPEERPLPEDALALVPLRDMVLFPGVVVPLALGRPKSIAAAQAAARRQLPIGVLLQRDPKTEDPELQELYDIGTTGSILRYVTTPDGTHNLVCRGERRFRLLQALEGYPYLAARVEFLPEEEEQPPEIEARMTALREKALEVLELLPQTPAELVNGLKALRSASTLADVVASLLDIETVEKQELLSTLDLAERLDRVLRHVAHRLEVLRMSQQISAQTRESLEERQREAILREQLRTIRRELGEEEEEERAEIEELRKAVMAAGMTEEAQQQALKELKRLERMPQAAAEYSMVRSYLEWLSELPWSFTTEKPIDIADARRILDEDHFDLERVKRRILEFLAVHKLNPEGRSPILCFVGPPGVGKTSLGQSIARAMGRSFVRASLGGLHDEAEIRGHRRTYIGALPGIVIQSLRKAGARDCVFMLDEMDKLGAGFHGDPASALLEVLDPEQNSTFRDNYLGVAFDLSRVLFIGTANVLDAIPGPLRDRMEVLELPGYTEDDKLAIAQRYLVARQREQNGLAAGDIALEPETLRRLIRDYTREAGLRNLERQIAALCRHAAVRIAEGAKGPIAIGPDDLPAILGPARFESEVAERTAVPGVATGLAWTPAGGDILFIEAARMPGTGKLILTGQLGDVMRESAQAALSLVKSRGAELAFEPDLFEKSDIHIHVPAGAIPKDGPSAGVAMYLALVSLLTGRTLRADTAVTGEISLRGLVLPVGGIKEKCVAAARAGVRRVLLPSRNRKDFEEIPESARRDLEFLWLETVKEAVEAALEPPGATEDLSRG